ncbi:MAG: hypothetical protein KGL52_10835 [Rhodospirillales bacterium]|nr:hypothetical protein [Rhodospirillales bacterium]
MQSVEYRTAGALALSLGGFVVAASMLLSQQHQASAVPAFAAQTGQPCTACHIGGFGPQLTPFGRAFKINGYTQGGGSGWEAHFPLSAMVETSFNHTAQDQNPPPHTFGSNNNFANDQDSVFIAGRVTDHTGGFIQLTYNNVDNRTAGTNGLSVDNTDLRPYTTTVQAFGNDLTLGLSVNNNPSVQDPYNSTPAWGYPYIASAFANGPAASTLLGGGSLAGNTIGVTAYAWYNEHLYLEAGGYGGMSTWLVNRFGVGPTPLNNRGLMPYIRAAYEWDWGNNAAWAGATFMHAAIDPGFSTGSDKYSDYAIDGGYEFLGTGKHIFTLQGQFIHETQNLTASTANYNATNGTNLSSTYGLNTINLAGSYWYENTYGLTLGWQHGWGDTNAVVYGPLSSGASANSSPDYNGFSVEADWVPFGKDKSPLRPWANLKLGVLYTFYTEMNGANSNYDGNGTNASDNNSVYLFAWLAF